SSVLPVGAKNVTNDLAIGLRVSLESAEKIKLALAVKPKFAVTADEKPAKNAETDELDISSLELPEELRKASRKTLTEGIIKPRLSEIFTYIGLEIQKSGYGGLTPSGVVITGGGAETIGALDTCRQRLVMPCRIGTPQGLSGLIEELSGPQNSTAIGLILFGKGSDISAKRDLPKMAMFVKMLPNLPLKNILSKVSHFAKGFLP
ncbi:MAG: cell division FtsA domain-containing protein, partial [Patescibacteria group bacterium]